MGKQKHNVQKPKCIVMQNREYKKNMLCKVSISISLCSRKVYLATFKVILGYAIELSSKYFTQIHCLIMPLTKNNNAAKFIVFEAK